MSYSPPTPDLESGAQALSTTNYSVDGLGYNTVNVHIQAYTSGTFTFQSSEDNATWVNIALTSAGSTTTGAVNTTATAIGLFYGPLPGRYFRITGGVGTVYVRLTSAGARGAGVGAAQVGTWTPTPTPATSGGLTIATGSIQATATAVKATAGQLYAYDIYNGGSAVSYMQLFNATTANVTLGSTTPTASIAIPATSRATFTTELGIAYATAITVAFTTTRTGSTNPSANCDYNIYYK